jgi:hypothetical protein
MDLAVGGPGGIVQACGGSADSGPLLFANGTTLTYPVTSQLVTPNTVSIPDAGVEVQIVPTSAAAPGSATIGIHAVDAKSSNDYTVHVTLVDAQLGVSAAFSPTTIAPGGTSTLTLSISNNSILQFTGVGLTANLSGGLQIAATPGVQRDCVGPLGAIPGTSSISLSGLTVNAGGGSCTLKIDVTAAAAGTPTVTTTPVSSNEQAPGPTASAQLNVGASGGSCALLPTPPATTFDLPAGNELGSYGTQLTWSTGCGSATGFSITQGALPTGLQINSNGSINGAPTVVGSFSFTVQVTGTQGSASQGYTLAINPARPTLTGRFNPGTIQVDGTTSLQFTILNNSRSVNLTGLAFSDTLPAGLQAATSLPATNGCGGTLSTTGGTISLAGGALTAQTNCTISIPILATTTGSFTNSTGPLTCIQTASSSGTTTLLTVSPLTSPAFVSKFTPDVVDGASPAVLSFDIRNPNAVNLTGLGFADSLPAGLQPASPSNATNTCGGTLSVGPSGFSLVDAGLGASGECTLSVDLAGADAGVFTNTARIQSNESGPGFTAASTLTVLAAPSGTLTSIILLPSAAEIVTNHTIALNALGNFSDGQERELTSLQWSSSAPTNASVTSQGVAQGLVASSTPVIIEAKDAASGRIGVTSLTVVSAGLVSIAVTPNPAQVSASGALQLTATGTKSDGTTSDLTSSAAWSSSIPSIATVTNGGGHSGQVAGLGANSTPTVITATDLATGISGSTTVLVAPLAVKVSVQPQTTDGPTSLACIPTGSTAPVVAWTGLRDDGTGGITFGNASALSTTATLTARPDGNGSGFYLFCSVDNPSTGFRGSNSGFATLATSGNEVQISISPSRIYADAGDVTLDATASPGLMANSWAVQYGGNVAANDIQDFLAIPQANWSPVFTGGAVAVLTVPAATFASPGAYRAQLTSTSTVDFSVSVDTFYFAVH